MRIISLIPIRKNSKRIKNKNLVNLGRKPLYRYAVDEALKSKYISEIFLATDINDIKIPKNKKLKIFKRSKASADATAPTEMIINEFLKKHKCDYLVLIQATNIFLKKSDLDEAIKKMINKKNDYDSLLSVVESKYFVWRNVNNKIVSHNFNYKKRPRSQDIQNVEYIENGSFYIFRRDNFFKYKDRLHGKITVQIMSKKSIFEIDELEDLDIVRKMVSK